MDNISERIVRMKCRNVCQFWNKQFDAFMYKTKINQFKLKLINFAPYAVYLKMSLFCLFCFVCLSCGGLWREGAGGLGSFVFFVSRRRVFVCNNFDEYPTGRHELCVCSVVCVRRNTACV